MERRTTDSNVVSEPATCNHRLDCRDLGHIVAVQDLHTTSLVRVDAAGRLACDCGRRQMPCRHLFAAARFLKRQHRAALTFEPLGRDRWRVLGDGEPYTIIAGGGALACSCADFRARRRCKHVRELQRRQARAATP